MQPFIVLLCIFYTWNVIFFTFCPAKTAHKASGVSGCRKAKCPGVCQGSGVQRGQCQQGSALLCPSCTKCTLVLLYTVLGRQAHQESLHSCTCALFSWTSWLSLYNFSVSCSSVRVLTVFLYWQYWCECSECLFCWTNEDHFPLIFYSGLRGRLLSLNKTSKLEKVWPQNKKHKVKCSVMLKNWSNLWPLYLERGERC